mmetsp:Transcript_9966/g.13038  ORF Transcript_9966/g.13038 Transcript_9966/m.13038 type:complete len:520 (-) Transcript_9966:796-2355(-)
MSKKGERNNRNLRHLLNFQYEQHENEGSINTYSSSNRKRGKAKNKGKRSNSFPAWHGTKEDYLNSISIFGLRADVCPRTTGLVGNTHVDWDDVVTILIANEEQDGGKGRTCCPICLDDLTAPRMTRCGHIFCWLCLSRLFCFSSGKVATCPLCFGFIELQEAKRVVLYDGTPLPKIGQKVSFNLAHRYSSCVVTKFLTSNDGQSLPPPDFCNDLPRFPDCSMKKEEDYEKIISRLYIETLDHRFDMVVSELVRLDKSMSEATHFGDTVGVSILTGLISELTSQRAAIREAQRVRTQRVFKRHQVPRPVSDPIKYLYCIPGCRNVYLHPFNVRCLLYQYQDMSSFPITLIGVKILDMETSVASPEILKRYTFLSHIPLMTTFHFLEIDLLSTPYLNEETKQKIRPEVKKRQEKRKSIKRAQRRKEKTLRSKTSLKSDWERQLSQLGDFSMESNQVITEELKEFLAPVSNQVQESTTWVNGGSASSWMNSEENSSWGNAGSSPPAMSSMSAFPSLSSSKKK